MGRQEEEQDDGSLDEELEAFIRETGVDEGAADKLRDEDTAVIRGVLENGIRPGARNPSALLMYLIKKVKGTTAEEPEDLETVREDLEAFLEDGPDFDEKAVEALRSQSAAVIRRVLRRGRFDSGRNPSAMLMAAIKEAKKDGAGDELPPPPRPEPTRHREHREHREHRGSRGSKELEAFIAENELDQATKEALYDAGERVWRYVLDQGPILGRNRSSVVMAWISKAQSEREDKPAMDLEKYVQESGIDDTAEEVLRGQSDEVIQAILQEGLPRGRNPSAILMTRIKRLHEDWEAAPPPARAAVGAAAPSATRSSDLEADIQAYVEENGVDSVAEEALRAQSDEVIQTVLEEGKLRGRNPSAILTARLRRLTDSDPWAAGQGEGERSRRGQGDSMAPWTRQSDSTLDLQTFCEESNVDDTAQEMLEAQSDYVVRTILEEGVLRGRNPSALLMARIRQLAKQEAGGGGGDSSRTRAAPGGRLSGSQAEKAEKSLATCLEELDRVAWDWSLPQVAVDDCLLKVAAARRAARAAHAEPEPSRAGYSEPPRKRHRDDDWGTPVGGGGRRDWEKPERSRHGGHWREESSWRSKW